MLKICFWNCQGYPWRKGAGLEPGVGDADIIFLAETWEHETCRLPSFEFFEVHSLWMPKKASSRRGQGGVACLFCKSLAMHMQIHKTDKHKRYIWLRISMPRRPLFVAGCYIPHFDSVFYNQEDMQQDDPFRDLETDIVTLMQEGDVMVLGDMNARVGNFQIGGDACELFPWHKEPTAKEMGWDRISEDITHGFDNHGKCLARLCGSTNMLILNGMSKWRSTGAFTCFTNTGCSCIDYFLAQSTCQDYIKHFELTPLQPESDHRPLKAHIEWTACTNQSFQQPRGQKMPRYKLNANEALHFSELVEKKLQSQTAPSSLKHKWESFMEAITESAARCFGKPTVNRKNHVHRSFPCNSWYDQECKEAREKVMLSTNPDEKKAAEKIRKTLLRRKRRQHELIMQEHKSNQLAQCPKGFWRQTKMLETENFGNIGMEQMLTHTKGLYEREDAEKMPHCDQLNTTHLSLHIDDIVQGLKKMSNGKAPDLQYLQAELFKWAGKEASLWMCDMLNQALLEGFHDNWTENWIKPLHKGGDRGTLGNYRTIMVGSTMAKLLGTILEQKISSWAEANAKRANGQAGFRHAHSTIDHLVTLRVLMEESRLRGEGLICCFVDFQKAFDTVPRLSLWQRMQKIGVPKEYMHAVATAYENVRCQIWMRGNLSESFQSSIGVKQGCPLSPTLFGLCIDELEEIILEHAANQGLLDPMIGTQIILLLLYADDIVLLAKTQEGAQKLMHILDIFCHCSGLQVNTDKTKVMLVKTHKGVQPHITYRGEGLETVESFKYLGIEVPSNHKWQSCVDKRIVAGWKSYYAFENTCRRAQIGSWRLKKYLFDTLVTPVLLYGVEVWGGSLSKASWNEVEKIQKRFLTSFLAVKVTTPYSILLIETGSLPIELLGMERTLQYLSKVTKLPKERLPYLAWEASCKRQKTYKSKTLASGWMEDIKRWFKRWDAGILLSTPIEDGKVIESFLQRRLLCSWEEAIHRTKFTYYTKSINPTFKDQFFAPREQRVQPYLLEPVPQFAIRTVASIRTGSHHLRCETGRWHSTGQTSIPLSERTCLLCHQGTVESEQHALLECDAYSHIRDRFAIVTDGHTDIAGFLSQCDHTIALGAYIAEVMKTRDAHMKTQM